MAVEMELARILIRETSDTHIVELREVGGERVFPIVIGIHEAAAIERRLMGQKPQRPQTHELLAHIIEELDWAVDRIMITELRDHTFYAQLVLRHQETGQRREIDSRPSDALALGASSEVPIYVEEAVLEEVCPPED